MIPVPIARRDAPAGTAVFALGSPGYWGEVLAQSMTEGVVSATHRVLDDGFVALQHSAALNRGNSGGPLLDDCGRVIGMVSHASEPGVAENMAFAIPVDVLKPIVEEIVATGHVARAWHGLYGKMVTPPVLAMLGIPSDLWDDYGGFLVETVEPGSAAEEIGLRGGDFPVEFGGSPYLIGGDIITEVNGVAITDMTVALDVVRDIAVGDTVTIVYKRGPETTSASVTIKERPIMEADLDRFRQ
jgi:S1-C subfamily serine protease